MADFKVGDKVYFFDAVGGEFHCETITDICPNRIATLGKYEPSIPEGKTWWSRKDTHIHRTLDAAIAAAWRAERDEFDKRQFAIRESARKFREENGNV